MSVCPGRSPSICRVTIVCRHSFAAGLGLRMANSFDSPNRNSICSSRRIKVWLISRIWLAGALRSCCFQQINCVESWQPSTPFVPRFPCFNQANFAVWIFPEIGLFISSDRLVIIWLCLLDRIRRRPVCLANLRRRSMLAGSEESTARNRRPTIPSPPLPGHDRLHGIILSIGIHPCSIRIAIQTQPFDPRIVQHCTINKLMSHNSLRRNASQS